jgi:hypothetical protein
MLIYLLLLSLFVSYAIHFLIIVYYIKSRRRIFFFAFISGVCINISLAIAVAAIALTWPELIRELKIRLFIWQLSGFISLILLAIQIKIFIKIYKKTRDPAWYHYNYFGKKVYEKGIVSKVDFFAFALTLPFFLLIGAYFIATLINIVNRGGF